MTILISTGRFLLPLMMLIIATMHSPIYWCATLVQKIKLIQSAFWSVRLWLVKLPILQERKYFKSGNSYVAWLDLYLLGVGRNLVPLGLGLGSAPRQQGKNLPGKWDCRARKLDSGNQLLIGAETRSLLSIIETLVRSTLVKCVLPMMMHFHIQNLPTKNQTHDTDIQYRKANRFPRRNSSQ